MKIEANLFSSNHHRSHFEQPASLDTKFHRAAIDGYVDMLCEASKRDTNLASEQNGLTPTLLAAHHGHLEALRILVGRGGDPEKTARDGSNALHLAAGRNHLNCVSFLVNFGVNMWALDNELRTAKDIAAIEQSKEVLDYLDQIMAKQSALNTKNVQKLKEKAKVATEKRLKQVRKAQLKAIKQVEKDERYLVKLSNNRRLLKAAHSISDIKLVGRPEQSHRQISYSPSDRLPGNAGACPPPSAGSSSVSSDPLRLSSSPNITNFINHKLHMDLLSRPRQLKFRPNNLSSSNSNSTTDESAYSSSSVSSTSGYLSTGGSSSALSMLAKHSSGSTKEAELRQPRYSDLVAVTNEQQLRLRSRSAQKQSSTEQQSLKSNSTIGNKLRGIGGVSRKVQLKRLLLVNSQSSNNLAMEPTDENPNMTRTSVSDEPEEAQLRASRQMEAPADQGGKLCNVQPTMKLKMVGSESSQPRQQPQSSSRISFSGGQTEQAASMIKWPPAPSMTRAVSEPDFGLALRCSIGEQEPEHDVGSGKEVHEADAPAEFGEPEEPAEDTKQLPNTDEMGAHEGQTVNRDESRHLLLTQCLSQLKMRHQAILKDQENETNKDVEEERNQQQQQPAKMVSGPGGRAPRREQQAVLYGTSDELLKHQLNAGEFPLRPSIIKQQQQQQQLLSQPNTSQQPNQQVGSTGKSSTAVSVDSIGSAGSLAQRNSGSSSSSKSSRSTTSSSLSYASSYTSSLEVGKMSQQNPSRVTMQKPVSTALGSCREEAPQVPLEEGAHCNPLAPCQAPGETIDKFLLANGLIELNEVFERERIDLEALMLLSEADLKSLDILLGPRRKLLQAIAIRRASRQSGGRQLGPMFVMVDTPL